MAIEVGNVFEGRVTGVKPFGAFVALPEGRVGMVHISEVSNEYVQDINTVLHDGDAVKVQVINIAPDGKIALSIKRLLPPAPRQPRSDRGPRPGGPRQGLPVDADTLAPAGPASSSRRAELQTLSEQIEQQKTQNEEMKRILSGDADDVTEWVARDSYNYAAPNERIFVDVTGN